MDPQIKNNKIQNSNFIFLEGLKSWGRFSRKSTNKKKSGLSINFAILTFLKFFVQFSEIF